MRRIFAIVAFIIISFFSWHVHDLVYGIRQLYGQLNIIFKAEPIDFYLGGSIFNDNQKGKLQLIKEVKLFAIDSLGLASNDNYTTVYDQNDQPILWIVSACQQFSLEPFEWQFPIAGKFPYKGFFNKDLALKEAQILKNLGMDVDVRTVGGWSTLGWLNDPILSNMLNDSEGELANTIIHELTHGTLFIKDDIEFNENLATFVGDEGAKAFLEQRFGPNSIKLRTYVTELQQEKLFVNYVIAGALALDSLYESKDFKNSEKKAELKQNHITQWINELDTIALSTYGNLRQRLTENHVNNTFFAKYRRYHVQQDTFASQFNNKFNGNLDEFLKYLFDQYGNN